MKYLLVFLLIFSQGVQATNFSLIVNDDTSKNLNFAETSDIDSSNEYTANNEIVKERLSSNNSKLLLKVGLYLLVFIVGFFCAILYYNYKLESLFPIEFDYYKSINRENNSKFSFLSIWLVKILKNRKEHYKSLSETTINTTNQTQSIAIKTKKETAKSSNSSRATTQSFVEVEDEIGAPTKSWDNLYQDSDGVKISIEKKSIVLFFSVPEQDGSFSIINSSPIAAGRSYYKVVYNEGETIGTLIYRTGELDESALSQMDFILSPACDIENSSILNPTNIEVQSEGKVFMDNEHWQIERKIKLKLS